MSRTVVILARVSNLPLNPKPDHALPSKMQSSQEQLQQRSRFMEINVV